MLTVCTDCIAGKYSAAVASVCTDCAAGKFFGSPAQASDVCTNCDAGQASSKGATVCTNCTAGTYSAAGASVCLNCAAGKFKAEVANTACDDCTAGKYSAAGALLCTTCGAGKYSAAVASVCTDCPAGTYSAALGAIAISTCSPCLDSASVLSTTTGATYVLGNLAPIGSTSKEACVNTRSSTCSNLPIGAELLLDQWLTCGACLTKCTADGDQMLIGTCNAEGSSGTTCETCAGDCRIDMTFSTDLYMTMTEFTTAKRALFLNAIKDSTKVPVSNLSIVHIEESSTTLVSRKYITVAATIVLSKTAAAKDALTSKNPAFTASSLKTALIANGFTDKVTDSDFNNVARFGTLFTDKGTVLAISKPSHTKVEGIVVVTKETLVVLMKVELPFTKDSFDANAQGQFLLAVANSAKTPVDNLYITSVVQKTSSRRVSRKLLAVSVEVQFEIRVQDAAAQEAMIANDGLTEEKLNSWLVKQVFPRFCVLWQSDKVFLCLLQTALRGREPAAAMMHACGCTAFRHPTGADYDCSAIQQGIPAGKVVMKPRAPSPPMTTPQPRGSTSSGDQPAQSSEIGLIVGVVVGVVCVCGFCCLVVYVVYVLRRKKAVADADHPDAKPGCVPFDPDATAATAEAPHDQDLRQRGAT
jgi:hypothetical protein